jgi:hypothetical protein
VASPNKPESYRGDDPFAFVAYSHGDNESVYAEITRITELGFRVYYDDGIHPGHRWREDIAEAIDRAALFILFISPRSIASEDCLRELSYALEQNRPVLAIHQEETDLPSGVKLSISDRQAILKFALSADEYLARLREALEEFIPSDQQNPPTQNLSTPVVSPASGGETQKVATTGIAIGIAVALIGVVLYQMIPNTSEDETGIDPSVRVVGTPSDDTSRIQPSELTRASALELLHEAQALKEDDQYGKAFLLIRQIGAALDDHPDLIHLKSEVLATVRPNIGLNGARVYFRPLQIGLDAEWIDAGVTPLAEFSAPLGVLGFRIEKPGYQTGLFVVANPGPLLDNYWKQDTPGPFPSMELALEDPDLRDFVHIPAAQTPIILQGSYQTAQNPAGGRPIDLPAYAIGRSEVTNREFKEFVDAGGYQNTDYWHDLSFHDTPFSLQEYKDRLVDTTGRPAPAEWELGNYPAGTADLPVGGLSWFEAMAYA